MEEGSIRISVGTFFVPSSLLVNTLGTAARLAANRNPGGWSCMPLTTDTQRRVIEWWVCTSLTTTNHACQQWPLYRRPRVASRQRSGRGQTGEHARPPPGG